MTIDKAIKGLHNWKEIADIKYSPYEQQSIQLGIEALEREQNRRKQLVTMLMEKDIRLLPSETEG